MYEEEVSLVNFIDSYTRLWTDKILNATDNQNQKNADK